MSFFDRLYVGKVLKDFGLLQTIYRTVGEVNRYVLLAERFGRLKLAIKTTAWGFLSAQVTYITFDLDKALILREFIDQAEWFVTNNITTEEHETGNLLDRVFAGKVVKDFGAIDRYPIFLIVIPVGYAKHSALLVEKDGELKFAIKFGGVVIGAASVQYTLLDLNQAYRLREMIDEAEAFAQEYLF